MKGNIYPSFKSARWEHLSRASGTTAGIGGSAAAVFSAATPPVNGRSSSSRSHAPGTSWYRSRYRWRYRKKPPNAKSTVPAAVLPLQQVCQGAGGTTAYPSGTTAYAARTRNQRYPRRYRLCSRFVRELAVLPLIPAVLPPLATFIEYKTVNSITFSFELQIR